jgi:hypothetical protein
MRAFWTSNSSWGEDALVLEGGQVLQLGDHVDRRGRRGRRRRGWRGRLGLPGLGVGRLLRPFVLAAGHPRR